MASKKIRWEALEHSHRDRSSDWFWAVGIIAIGGAVLAIFFDNLLFGILILLGAFTAILQAHTSPKRIGFEINRTGVRVGDIIYPYSNIESFWVIDEEYDDRIILRTNKVFLPFLVLPFDSLETNADEIREYLLEYLDEEEMDEPFFNKIMEMFGF